MPFLSVIKVQEVQSNTLWTYNIIADPLYGGQYIILLKRYIDWNWYKSKPQNLHSAIY